MTGGSYEIPAMSLRTAAVATLALLAASPPSLEGKPPNILWLSIEDTGQPVDASGTLHLPGGETLTFADGVDFAHQLAASPRVRDCYALHWTRYALGDRIASSEPALEPIRRPFRDDDSIKNLLVSIATSDLFRFGADADADAPGDAR